VYARGPFVRFMKCPGGSMLPAGEGRRDRLVLPWGTVFDLAGNASEYLRDLWDRQTESCWGAGVFRDPVCDEARAAPHLRAPHALSGGSWFTPAFGLAAAAFPIVSTGFRCARAVP
jgi:hypothetical protein